MIKNTFIWSAALLATYSVLLAIPAMRSCFSVQSLWQDNLIRFQEFAAQNPRPEYVIVGTSLVRGIDASSISPRCYNLAATGGNVMTGLEVISRQSQLPRVLFVETTMLMQDGAEGVADNALRPVFAQLRPWVPMLRERYQPANALGWLVGDQLIRHTLAFSHIPVQSTQPGEAPREEARFAEARTREIASRQNLYDPKRLEGRVALMKHHIDELIERGVRIVLIEMPHDSLVMSTPMVRQMHDALFAHFLPTNYTWIRPDPAHTYDTTDAIHLTAAELLLYQRAIQQHLLPAP